jgi:hypothetical protein
MFGQAIVHLLGLVIDMLITDSMQLADELPMIYTVCIMSVCLTFAFTLLSREEDEEQLPPKDIQKHPRMEINS